MSPFADEIDPFAGLNDAIAAATASSDSKYGAFDDPRTVVRDVEVNPTESIPHAPHAIGFMTNIRRPYINFHHSIPVDKPRGHDVARDMITVLVTRTVLEDVGSLDGGRSWQPPQPTGTPRSLRRAQSWYLVEENATNPFSSRFGIVNSRWVSQRSIPSSSILRYRLDNPSFSRLAASRLSGHCRSTRVMCSRS
jgi:hypothetical protein